MNTFHCKRCGACCKPGWLVDTSAGRPYTKLERLKSFVTSKPLPPRVVYINFTQWLEEDIVRAASFLGITFEKFIEKYKLDDDLQNYIDQLNNRLDANITKQDFLEKEAARYNMSIHELKQKKPQLRAYQLYTHKQGVNRNCPFVIEHDGGMHVCSLYEARPAMCRDYPSKKQLQERFDFYQPHCPGFEEE